MNQLQAPINPMPADIQKARKRPGNDPRKEWINASPENKTAYAAYLAADREFSAATALTNALTKYADGNSQAAARDWDQIAAAIADGGKVPAAARAVMDHAAATFGGAWVAANQHNDEWLSLI